MKIYWSKKRLLVLCMALTAVLGVTAVQAGAVDVDLKVKGKGVFCLAPAARRALAANGVTLEPIAPATGSGDCVTLPGTGTLKPDLTGGELPLEGGMRFSGAGHRLEATHLVIHVRLGEGSTSADIAQDGAAPTGVSLFHYPIARSSVSLTPTSVTVKDTPLALTAPGTAAFTQAFGSSPTSDGNPLFLFDGNAEIINPFAPLPRS
ncbi:hypothetical protein AB0P15_31295 [Streptomyces sp. NPDC087917]|uniref:hypothetical protein n=1 Tax=Streptomyces sp. NPDC087917 TaxID=3155060 RepID=UPI00341FDF89